MDSYDEALYRKHADSLIRLASSMVGRSDAEDVLSEAVLRVMNSRNWANVENKKAYLYRSVANEAQRFVRSRSRRQQRQFRFVTQGNTEPEEIPTESFDLLSSLTARQRAVVYLTYWEDLDGAACGRSLGISEGAVRRHLHRAKAKIRRSIDAPALSS
jgi:RNA polymerase sigma factor (sigma-70 family)